VALKTGKLDPATLRRLVLEQLGVRRDDVVVHARLGEDAAAVAYGGEVCVLSSDPITGAGAAAGWYAVHVSCNDIAAMGARPVGVLATLIFPPTAEEAEVAQVMSDIHRAALELEIEVLGGHTEVASSVVSPIISMTAVGRARREQLVTSGGAQPGDTLLLTKWAALEGTAILATDLAAHLDGKMTPEAIARAQGLSARISVVRDGVEAAKLGATALHDPTEGGVLGALWELAEASACGFEVDASAVPILEETRQVCAVFGADPLKLISSGAMLIACPDLARMLAGLAEHRIPAVHRDELWRILEQLG
jgi:hydrogenase expression/formation protein HypE